MSVDRDLWRETFERVTVPPLPCPACRHGRLGLVEASLKIAETKSSLLAHEHEAWDPSWREQRFIALLQCAVSSCGEFVAVVGDTVPREVYEEDLGHVYVDFLRPKAMFPGPPIISIPSDTPELITKELKLAFQLYWTDAGASASRLRTSAERLLDHFGVPKTRKDSKNKRVPNTLNNRIDALEAKKPGYKNTLHALRIVGNLGTHEGAQREPLLDAFAIYEEALAELFGQRTKRIGRLIKKLTTTRGKYKQVQSYP